MSITDELRRYISGPAKSGISHICEKAITDIADRIDAEHESACGEAYGNGVQSVALPDMTAYVKLPVDADGVPIRVGDVMDGYGKTIEVVEMRHGRSGWVLISRDGNGYADTFAFAHHHEPTVEDVLREFAEKMAENTAMYVAESWDADERDEADAAAISEYAAKLRLAGDAE